MYSNRLVKALALSKFQYVVSLVTVPDHVIKQVNSMIYEFIWNGKTDKVKRNLFEQAFMVLLNVSVPNFRQKCCITKYENDKHIA